MPVTLCLVWKLCRTGSASHCMFDTRHTGDMVPAKTLRHDSNINNK